jgi:beta-glucanase (GH16 family)
MKKILLSVLLVLLPAVAQPAYFLSWSDEFDYPGCTAANPCAVDPSKWDASDGSRFQADPVDIPYYTSRLQNVCVQDGSLFIESRYESYKGYSYTSGNVDTFGKKGFQFGKLEVRARGTSAVNSVDQAIWVYNSSGSCGTIYTDGGGEVDLLEFYPGSSYWNGKVAQSFHTADHPQDPYETVLDAKQWHVYFMEWDNTSVRIGVDGVTKHTYAKSTGTCNDYLLSAITS